MTNSYVVHKKQNGNRSRKQKKSHSVNELLVFAARIRRMGKVIFSLCVSVHTLMGGGTQSSHGREEGGGPRSQIWGGSKVSDFGGGPRSQIFSGGPRSQIFRGGGSQVSDFWGGSRSQIFRRGVPDLRFLGGTQSQ